MLTSAVCAFGDVLTLAVSAETLPVSSRLCKGGPHHIRCHGGRVESPVPRPPSAAPVLGHVCGHFAELSPEFVLVICPCALRLCFDCGCFIRESS